MKRATVPALRKRASRPDAGGCAEPQTCERQFKQQERNSDGMKTYILRVPKSVEPQRPARAQRRPTRRASDQAQRLPVAGVKGPCELLPGVERRKRATLERTR